MDPSKKSGSEVEATETNVCEPVASGRSTSAVDSADTLDLGSGNATAQALKLPRPLGGYELLRRLGQGGMGEVFEARHSTSGDRVALKLLPLSTGGKMLQYFKREFRSLTNVHHANLVGMHTLECDGEQWFLTMDLVEGGVDFLSYVRPEGKLDEERLRAKLKELASAVAALHARGIVHRDLKPGNVMVDREGRLTVLDFGLVLEMKSGISFEGGEIQGTPGYMSPQQVNGEVSTPACDWYALGTMIYRAITGKLPFSDKSVMKLLRAKLTNEAPPLTGEGPADLCELATKMLRLDPAERPKQDDIFQALSLEAELQPRDLRVDLIGRADQLRQLDDVFQEVNKERNARLVQITGKSGEGKSSLVDAFLRSVEGSQHVVVFASRCYDRESVPFKALDGVIDSVCHFLRRLNPADVQRMLPDDIGFLGQLFPVLSQVKVIEDAARQMVGHWNLDSRQVRLRAFVALKQLLTSIGTERTIVIFIDDLQWGDADSAEALFELLKPPTDAALLVIGTCRSDQMEQSRFLQNYHALQARSPVTPGLARIEVGKLTDSESRKLIVGAAPFYMEEQDPIVEEIIAEAAGNPYLTLQLVESLHVDENRVTYRTLHDVIATKLAGLPDLADDLLKLLTVFGRDIAMSELADAAGNYSTTISTLTRMRSQQLVRWLSEDDEPVLDIYHDQIRESVLAQIPISEKCGLHHALAETIERRAGGVSQESLDALSLTNESLRARLFDLSSHFDAAGTTAKARYYGLLAAEQACKQLALEVASQHYKVASRHAAGSSDAIRYRIAFGFADTLAKLGKSEEANDLLDQADRFAASDIERGQNTALRVGIALKQKHAGDALETCIKALHQLGIRVPSSHVEYLAASVWEWFTGWLFKRWSSDEIIDRERRQIALRLLARLAHYYGSSDNVAYTWVAIKTDNLARNIPGTQHRATTCIVVSHMQIQIFGRVAKAIPKIEETIKYCSDHNDRLHEAHVSLRAASYLAGVGEASRALQYASNANSFFEETGSGSELVLAKSTLAHIHYFLGDLDLAIRYSRAAFDMAIQQNRRYLYPGFLVPWARATEGDLPIESLFQRWQGSELERLMVEGCWHMRHKRHDSAHAAMKSAWWAMVRGLRVLQNDVWVLPARVTALRKMTESHDIDSSTSRSFLRGTLRFARWVTRACKFYPGHESYALRELALLLQKQSKLNSAYKHAKRSCEIAQQQDAKFELAQSLLVKGKIARQLGIDEEPDVQAAERELVRIRDAAAVAISEVSQI